MYVVIILIIPFIILITQLVILRDLSYLEDDNRIINNNLKRLNKNLENIRTENQKMEEILKGSLNNNVKELQEHVKSKKQF